MKRTSTTRAIRLFHIWAGLAIGALFCIMSLSGSVLVLRPAIEDWLRPAWISKSDARPAQVLTEAANNIAHRWPGASITRVAFPDQAGPVEFVLLDANDGELRVFTDARSGEVLGTFALPWIETLTDLHHHILVESIGKKVVGFIGIFLVLSSLTGFVMWVRRSNRRLVSGALTKFNLHRSAGVIGNVALLFVAATGVLIAFPQTITQLLGGPPPPRPVVVAQNPARHTTFEAYIAAAELAVPGGAVRQLRLPRNPDRPVTARVRTPGDLRQDGSTRVSLEPVTARVVSLDRPEDWPVSKAIVQAATPLHYGECGGLALRMLWFLVGLLPPALFVTGTMMWWAPRGARRKAASRRAAEEKLVA